MTRITRTCCRLMTLSARLRVIQRALGTHRRKVHLTHVHFRNKLASRASCHRSRIRLTHATALIPSLRHGVDLGRGSVTFLTKRCPGGVTHDNLLRRFGFPGTLPINLPSTLLRHHPSVHRTRRGLVTTGTGIKMTCAGVFPHVSLANETKTRDAILSSLLGSPCNVVRNTLLAPVLN